MAENMLWPRGVRRTRQARPVAQKAGRGREVPHHRLEARTVMGVDWFTAAIGHGEAVDDGVEPGGVPLGDREFGLTVPIFGREGADHHVFEAEETIAASAELLGRGRGGEASELDPHRFTVVEPMGLDTGELIRVDRPLEAGTDDLVDR